MTVFQNMVDFLDSTWDARSVIVPCLLGEPGIGKTAAVKQHVENVGAGKLVTIILSQALPTETSGITMPDPQTKAMEIYDHHRLSSLEDGDILFFDEVLEADQVVLSACLTLIESREMNSGNRLKDIQIVAACNPTIKPTMLKLNIRQRFVWQEFQMSRNEVKDYLNDRFNLKLNDQIASRLQTSGKSYNVLTPRTLTKMCEWFEFTPMEKWKDVEYAMNECWEFDLGSSLMSFFNEREKRLEIEKNNDKLNEQFNESLWSAIVKIDPSIMTREDYNTLSMKELVEVLEGSSEWKRFEEELAKISVPVNYSDVKYDEEIEY